MVKVCYRINQHLPRLIDGLNIYEVTDSRFDRLHVHHNGRSGIAITAANFQNLQFNDCVIEMNEVGGIDMEPASGTGLIWNNCTFRNQHSSCQVVGGQITRMELNNCIFDGSYEKFHIFVESQNISNFSIVNCSFRNTYSGCIVLHAYAVGDGGVILPRTITGVISGCKFEEATGRVQEFGTVDRPLYYTLSNGNTPIIDIQGAGASLSINGNYFEPWFFPSYVDDRGTTQNYARTPAIAPVLDGGISRYPVSLVSLAHSVTA